MDVAIYRDALLKKRGELLAGSAAKPLQWTCLLYTSDAADE